jgi:hypothetical protein
LPLQLCPFLPLYCLLLGSSLFPLVLGSLFVFFFFEVEGVFCCDGFVEDLVDYPRGLVEVEAFYCLFLGRLVDLVERR